ncbi:NAD-dependent epimerase/dehydratase family protein [Neoroseomonas lacus]|uniref:NAD-dependent epimerase n=1 Tax=Neoroseomonas lacus TaxID=287609 RepID=A0A917K4Q7_9PROT|nr:NAD-dependent epimerase/dehydratase family protein [Neoroseomonas lacus]GGI97429.1 NAD-dependent epimerase [Neoroseomonas lacus]
MSAQPLWLVTGGCGFIGSHLCAALIAAGQHVRVLDDLSTGRRENLAPGATLMVGDVGDPSLLAAAMEGVSGCFHLAAIASVERATREWREAHRVNLSAFVAVLDAACAAGRVPVVYASSAAVYGSNADLPLGETAATRPLSAYGADKLGCELHARVAGVVHGLPTLGLRFFNVYGARQDPASPYSGVISIFADRLLRGEPIAIFGDGLQSRDFVPVSDVVAALRAAMMAADLEGRAFNVCSGRATTVLELARTLADTCGGNTAIRHLPARAGEVRHSLGDPTASRTALGLTAPRELADGLRDVMSWMRAGRPLLAPALTDRD